MITKVIHDSLSQCTLIHLASIVTMYSTCLVLDVQLSFCIVILDVKVLKCFLFHGDVVDCVKHVDLYIQPIASDIILPHALAAT